MFITIKDLKDSIDELSREWENIGNIRYPRTGKRKSKLLLIADQTTGKGGNSY